MTRLGPACLLVVAAIQSVSVIAPRRYQAAHMGQLQSEWENYDANGHLSDAGIVGLFGDQLIKGSPENKSPLQSLHDDAEERGKHFRGAIRALGCSIIMMALVLVVAALQAATK